MIRTPVQPDSLAAETYRSLSATLAYSRLAEGRRTVLFTSAAGGEGKSTTAANFATVCAYGERRTLLVDADLRSPQLAALFHVSEEPGLGGALQVGGLPLADVVRQTTIPYLDLLPAGRPSAKAPELLARSQLADLLEQARERYEWVVLDSPPVLPVADALVLSRFVDGVLLVVDVRATSIDTARRARELLRAVDAPLVGIVANRVRSKGSSTGYGRYPR